MLEMKTYKNWKEICEAMNWSTTGGDTKVKYLKILGSFCKYYKEGNKYVITEIFAEPKEIEDKRKNNKGGKEPKYLKYTLPLLISLLSVDTEIMEKEEVNIDMVCYKGKVTDTQIINRFFGLKKLNPHDINIIREDYRKIVNEKKLKKWENELIDSLYAVEYRIVHSSTLHLLAKKYNNSIETLIRGFKKVSVMDEKGETFYEETIGDLDVYSKVKKLEDTWRTDNGGKRSNVLLTKDERKDMQSYVLDKLQLEAVRYQRVNSIEIYVEDKKVLEDLSALRNEFRILVFDEFIKKNVENIRERTYDAEVTNKFEMPYKIDMFNYLMDSLTRYPKSRSNKKEYRRLKRELTTLRAEIVELKIENAMLQEENRRLKEEINKKEEE